MTGLRSKGLSRMVRKRMSQLLTSALRSRSLFKNSAVFSLKTARFWGSDSSLARKKSGDEGGLAHSAPSVQHDQGAAGAVIFGLQGLKLLLTVYKMLHEITSLLYFLLLYRRLL